LTATETLSGNQKRLVLIAAHTAVGELEQLKKVLNEALDEGLKINEAKEVMIHSYAYAGFPRSLNGLMTLMNVLDNRKDRGITDQLGKDATKKDLGDKDKYGSNVRDELTGVRAQAAYQKFAPEIDGFLKQHLFADLFSRDIFSYLDRELVTISILASLANVNAQLKTHIHICRNLGMTDAQLANFQRVFIERISVEKADNIGFVLKDIFNA
jgi:4-carboxymuconolactone decarboxylase